VRTPYVIGAFLTGREHYGREALLSTVLEGQARAHWIVGNRRVGKTSLLRQIEFLASDAGHLIPLYWDMQGCVSYADLGRCLADAVRDHLVRFAPLGLPPALADEQDALTLLTHIRRLAVRANRELLLLCDEPEALLEIAANEPAAMQRLHRVLTGGAGVRSVMASTRAIYRLYDVCRDWPTSPFLGGFDMSHTVGSLAATDARKVILRTQAPRGGRIKATAAVLSAIKDATNNHPLLLQHLCSRLLLEDGTLRLPSDADLRVDSMIAGFLEYDFRQLTKAARELLLSIYQIHRANPRELQRMDFEHPAELKQRVANLEALGYLRKMGASLAIGNVFLQNWLETQVRTLPHVPSMQTSQDAMRTVFARQREHDTSSLVLQLNLRRARLVELEGVRAQELLGASPSVLAEIRQLELEITNLRELLRRRSA